MPEPEPVGELPRDATPARVEGADMFASPLSPDDLYVLGWIDGLTTVDDICLSGALDPAPAAECLRRLADAGLIHIPGYGPPPAAPDSTERPRQDATAPPSERSTSMPEGARVPTIPVPGYDAEAVAENVDLDNEERLYILTFVSRTDGDHYAVLGVARDASVAEIGLAATRLSGWVDDRLARSNLGSFLVKLEAMEAMIETAADLLSNASSRAFYDRSIS